MTDAEGNEIGKLFVGGLSQATNNGSLRLYFSRFGEVDDAVVMMDNKTGRSRGFGYVKYREPESVSLALEAKPHILDGKEVDAKQCNVNMKGRNRRSLKVFVGGIGLDQDAESIKNFFRQFGRVTDVNLMMDSNKQRHRGFAFVGFEDEAVVKRLIGLHYVTMNNKQVEIKAMEPPNFGRKLAVASCLTNGAMVVGANSGDNGCAHACDQSTEVGGLLTGGLASLAAPSPYGTHPHSYLTTQPNLMGQPRLSPHATYEHPAGAFGSPLIPDNLLQSAAFVHPLAPTHYRASGEAVLASGSSGAPFSPSKQPVPVILTNNQLQHPSAITPPGLGTFGPSASSLYAVPCQLVPQQFVSPSQPANFGQIINAEKGSLTGWQTSTLNPTQLTMCPPQVATQGGLITCSQYLAGQPVAQTSTVQNPQQPNAVNIPASILTPYYAVCSPYTAITLPPDQTSSAQFANLQPNAATPAILTGFTACGLQGPSSGAGETSLIHMPNNSRPSSPNNETKAEAGSSVNSLPMTKVVYPSVIMPTQNGMQTPLIQGSSNAINMGQSPYGHAPASLLYPSLPVGWTVHPPTHPVSGQTLSPLNTLAAQQLSPTNIASANQLKPQGVEGMSVGNTSPAVHDSSSCTKERLTDQTQVAPTKASGDSLDSFIVVTEQSSELPRSEAVGSDSDYRSAKGRDSSDGKPEVKMGASNMWPVNGTGASRSSDSVAWPNTFNASAASQRWNDITNVSKNINSPSNMVLHPQPWSLPLELIEETANYDVSLQGNGRVVQSGNCSSSHTNSNITQIPNVKACPTQHTVKSTETSNKPSTHTQCSPTSDCTKVSQRLPQYTQAPRQQSNGGQKQPSGQSIKQHTSSPTQQAMCPTTGFTKVQPSLGDSTDATSKVKSNNGSVVRLDLGNGRENPSRHSHSSWLYSNTGGSGHLESNTCVNGKDLPSPTNIGVELECQGPAGAAGDFQRPVHTGHYPVYH